MAHVPDVVLDLYAGVPKDCFVSGVPFTLRGHEDNEVIPSFDTVIGPDNVPSKWIRFCDFLPFVSACRAYWMSKMEHPLYVYVMPYAPLNDSSYLHELIEAAHPLPYNDAEDDDQPIDLGIAPAPQQKKGKVEVNDGTFLSFTVVNYMLLWSKAVRCQEFLYFTGPLQEWQRRAQMSNKVLQLHASTPGESVEQLLDTAQNARRRLALVLMDKYTEGVVGVDPHDALLSMYPTIHDEVYQGACECYHAYQEDQPAVDMTRLESAMMELDYEESDIDNLSVRQAEYDLMHAAGTLEFHDHHTRACADFVECRNTIGNCIKPVLEYVRVATTSHCLMGVLSQYEDGNPSGEN